MPELPSHQDTGSSVSPAPIAATSRRRTVLTATVVVVLAALAVVLHLTGVIGGGGH